MNYNYLDNYQYAGKSVAMEAADIVSFPTRALLGGRSIDIINNTECAHLQWGTQPKAIATFVVTVFLCLIASLTLIPLLALAAKAVLIHWKAPESPHIHNTENKIKRTAAIIRTGSEKLALLEDLRNILKDYPLEVDELQLSPSTSPSSNIVIIFFKVPPPEVDRRFADINLNYKAVFRSQRSFKDVFLETLFDEPRGYRDYLDNVFFVLAYDVIETNMWNHHEALRMVKPENVFHIFKTENNIRCATLNKERSGLIHLADRLDDHFKSA